MPMIHATMFYGPLALLAGLVLVWLHYNFGPGSDWWSRAVRHQKSWGEE